MMRHESLDVGFPAAPSLAKVEGFGFQKCLGGSI